MNKSEFVRNELATLPLVDWSTQNQAKIICPFHDDTNPSLNVSLVRVDKGNGRGVAIGGFNCWSCKAHGPWNKLAAKLNLNQWTETVEKEAADLPSNAFKALEIDLGGIQNSNTEYEKPVTDGPWEGPWRGLPGSFLRSVGAEMMWDNEYGEHRIYLPIHNAVGKLIGHVAARGENSNIPDKKKYLNSKNFNGRTNWYGLNWETHPKAVVIVEGPFDMLRFRYHGLPAIANLGVQLRNEKDLSETVSTEKVMQIISKGCNKVVLALDADRAGREALAGFLASFDKHGVKVFDLNMSRYLKNPNDPDEKMDPGNCPLEVIDDLKSFLKTLE